MRWNLQRHGPRIVQHDLGSEGAVNPRSQWVSGESMMCMPWKPLHFQFKNVLH